MPAPSGCRSMRIPVIPPDLPQCGQLDGGRAPSPTSDSNDLIAGDQRTNRLARLAGNPAPEIIVPQRKAMLQRLFDALGSDNAAATHRGGGQQPPLKSLSDNHWGKQGRLPSENLLGKRVDYSAARDAWWPQSSDAPVRTAQEAWRSSCFQPFVIHRLDPRTRQHIKAAIKKEADSSAPMMR